MCFIRCLLFFIFIIPVGCVTVPSDSHILDTAQNEFENEKAKAEVIGKGDPDSPYADVVKACEKGISYCKKVRGGGESIDPESLLAMLSDVKKKVEIAERTIMQVVGSDIAFGSGRFKVTEIRPKGRTDLDLFVGKIINVMKGEKGFVTDSYLITLETIAYADGVPPGDRLKTVLKRKGCFAGTKAESASSDQYFNRMLSLCRANSINFYIENKLNEKLKGFKVQIKSKGEGKGELFPYDNPLPPYKKDDVRRRVCKLKALVEFR